MILETIDHKNGTKTHVIYTRVFNPTNSLDDLKIKKSLKTTYLRWEFDLRMHKMKIQAHVKWHTTGFLFPKWWCFWRPIREKKMHHEHTFWMHEDDISFYTFYQGECQ